MLWFLIDCEGKFIHWICSHYGEDQRCADAADASADRRTDARPLHYIISFDYIFSYFSFLGCALD